MGNTKTNRGEIMKNSMGVARVTAFEFAADLERKAANKKFRKDFTEVVLSILTCGLSTVIIGIVKGI